MLHCSLPCAGSSEDTHRSQSTAARSLRCWHRLCVCVCACACVCVCVLRRIDAYQLPSILGLGCDPPKGTCSTLQLASFQQYRLDMMAALNASGIYRPRAGHGM